MYIVTVGQGFRLELQIHHNDWFLSLEDCPMFIWFSCPSLICVGIQLMQENKVNEYNDIYCEDL